jgi:mannosyltransferase OCH1-like enzyme
MHRRAGPLQRRHAVLLLAACAACAVALGLASALGRAAASLKLTLKALRIYRAELERYLPPLEASPSWQTDAVPPLLHFVVPANTSRWHALWRPCHDTWRAGFPAHTVRLWSDEEAETLVRGSYPQFLKLYLEYPRVIQRVDMVRYLILHAQGGIYVDSDYQCVRNFEALLPRGRASLGESPHGGEGVQNALMASPAKHPFWAYVMRELLANAYVSDVVLSTGPRPLLFAAEKAPRSMVHFLPRDAFARWPRRAEQALIGAPTARVRMYEGGDARVYAVHLGTETWNPAKG